MGIEKKTWGFLNGTITVIYMTVDPDLMTIKW
jgi:hypothetical protein